jgi:hypothetical protein
VSPVTLLLLGVVVAIVAIAMIVARPAPRDGGELLGLRSARRIAEDREALEAEDLAQLLEASNARRRRRGERERTLEDVELEVSAAARADRRGSAPSRPR